MGKFSRDKGRRNEYALRDHLRKLGFEAVRVPLSGSSEGFKYDIVASKDGVHYTFELKARKDSFKKIYQFFNLCKTHDSLRLYYPETKDCVSITSNFMNFINTPLQDLTTIYTVADPINFDGLSLRSLNKVITLKQYLQGAQFLVIKDDHQPLLFLKYS